ncbi:MAG: LuxR C-terminal-related transcriptional regulator [Chloroflexaceae bacterium]|jgi:ATP/maltotriose-dependent transcriptional regulator MalT|nr:LuxR C-terminal-related transcriptional regulator [Chloroflexaceae bacterium]
MECPSSPLEPRAQRYYELARDRFAVGDYDAARTYINAACAATDAPTPDMLRLMGNLAAEFQCLSMGVPLLERALEGFRLAEDTEGEAIALADLAALLQRLGDLGRAHSLIQRALVLLAPENTAQRARLLNIAGSVASFQGRLDEALALLEEAATLASGRYAVWVGLNQAAALDNLGRHAEAGQVLAATAELLPPDDGVSGAFLAYTHAWHALAQGNHSSAYAAAHHALQQIGRMQHPVATHPTLATLGILAREAGRLDEAAELLNQARELARPYKDRAMELGLRWHGALLHWQRGESEAALAELTAVVAAMEAGGYGTTLLWQPGRFAELCRWGLAAGLVSDHAPWLLRTTLAPPPTLHQADITSLTRREREVLQLAAQGLRDEEIATRLCVSIRTVQNHMQRVYDKLGVRNRMAAIRQLEATPPAAGYPRRVQTPPAPPVPR